LLLSLLLLSSAATMEGAKWKTHGLDRPGPSKKVQGHFFLHPDRVVKRPNYPLLPSPCRRHHRPLPSRHTCEWKGVFIGLSFLG